MPSAACTLQPSARSASIHSSRMVIASAPRRKAPTRAAASRHSPCTRSLSCASAPHTCSPLAAPASGYGADGGRCTSCRTLALRPLQRLDQPTRPRHRERAEMDRRAVRRRLGADRPHPVERRLLILAEPPADDGANLAALLLGAGRDACDVARRGAFWISY